MLCPIFGGRNSDRLLKNLVKIAVPTKAAGGRDILDLFIGIFLQKIAGAGYSESVNVCNGGGGGQLLENSAIIFLSYSAKGGEIGK